MVLLNFRDAKPIYEQLIDGIRRLVITGALKEDEKLPSVRELASTLTINPNTISRAYKALEEEGYLYSICGKGTFVSQNREAYKKRADELLFAFDEIARELMYLSVQSNELKNRIDMVNGKE